MDDDLIKVWIEEFALNILKLNVRGLDLKIDWYHLMLLPTVD